MRVNSRILVFFAFQGTNTSVTQGTYEVINGIKTYVATPKIDYPKDKAIIYVTDVFGLELSNNRVRCPLSSQPNLVSYDSCLQVPSSSLSTTLLVTASRYMRRSSSRVIPSRKMLSAL